MRRDSERDDYDRPNLLVTSKVERTVVERTVCLHMEIEEVEGGAS